MMLIKAPREQTSLDDLELDPSKHDGGGRIKQTNDLAVVLQADQPAAVLTNCDQCPLLSLKCCTIGQKVSIVTLCPKSSGDTSKMASGWISTFLLMF